MADVEPGAFEHVSALPEHERVMRALVELLRSFDGCRGILASGSTSRGGMDRWSDLDLGAVFDDDAARELAWNARWDWELPSWFHRFDADHVKDHFVIYLFDGDVKADIALYTPEEMPSPLGAPYTLVWRRDGWLAGWLDALDATPPAPDWSQVVHEDERFWAWQVYSAQHIARGEYHHIANEFIDLRAIVRAWAGRLAGHARFDDRRLEQRPDGREALDRLSATFPSPNHAELKSACIALLEYQLELRARIDAEIAPKWKTPSDAIRHIQAMVRAL